MAKYVILMGDVIGSRQLDATDLRRGIQRLLSICNRSMKEDILSPYTTTLGDEFQGVAASLRAAAECIFFFEEKRIASEYDFGLRYVAHCGEIQTPNNREIAYGMMGPGLTRARALLTERKRGQPRIYFDLPNKRLADNLTRLCRVIDGLTARWDRQDYKLITDMLSTPANEAVASKYGKNRSQIWKRRRHLLIQEYLLTKSVVFDLIGPADIRQRK